MMKVGMKELALVGITGASIAILALNPNQSRVLPNGQLALSSESKTTPLPEPKNVVMAPVKAKALPVVVRALRPADDSTKRNLSAISSISKKAFQSDAEKRDRARLLRDRDFLMSVATYLESQATDMETRTLQNQAVDALLDARREHGSEEAARLMRALIEDPQIESDAIEKSARENLAGIKAEVLYWWSAQEPSVAQKFPDLLPGPVSRKIWENVQDTQSRNLAESRVLED